MKGWFLACGRDCAVGLSVRVSKFIIQLLLIRMVLSKKVDGDHCIKFRDGHTYNVSVYFVEVD